MFVRCAIAVCWPPFPIFTNDDEILRTKAINALPLVDFAGARLSHPKRQTGPRVAVNSFRCTCCRWDSLYDLAGEEKPEYVKPMTGAFREDQLRLHAAFFTKGSK